MASKQPTSSAELRERVRDQFARDRNSTAHPEDEPERRGLAISVCVLISALLWFTLTMRETYTVTLELPTRLVNLPSGEALARRPPEAVRAQVSGEGFQLLQLYYNPAPIPIDAMRDEVDFASALQELPKGVQLDGVSPRTFSLRTEERITRQIPIRLRADVQTPPTHDLIAPPRIRPDSVVVSGAASIIENLEAWPTEPFERAGLRDSLNVRVALSDTLRGLVELSRQAATLFARAEPFTEGTREVDVQVSGIPTDERFVTLDPETITVRYRVPLAQYEEAQQATNLFATVSYNEIRIDTTGRVQPELHLPPGLTLRDVELTPPILRYYIHLRD